jgi:hypothetical protein
MPIHRIIASGHEKIFQIPIDIALIRGLCRSFRVQPFQEVIMRKVLLVLLVAMLAVLPSIAQSAGADKESGSTAMPKIGFDFNALGILIDDFSGSAEMAFTPNISGKVYIEYSPNLVWISDISVLGLQLEGRYYFSDLIHGTPSFLKGKAIKGLFGGVGLGFYSLNWNYSGIGYTGSYFAPDFFLEVGTKYMLGQHWYLDGALGYDIVFSGTWTWKDSSGNTIESFTATPTELPGGLRYTLTIGYAL